MGGFFCVDFSLSATLENITVDGGAVWSGEFDDTLERGIENIGITTLLILHLSLIVSNLL